MEQTSMVSGVILFIIRTATIFIICTCVTFLMLRFDVSGYNEKRLKTIENQLRYIDCVMKGNRLVCNNGQEYECPEKVEIHDYGYGYYDEEDT